MTALADINRKAHAVLRRELGAADFARFLLQFDTGAGDYTAERQAEDRPSAEAIHQQTIEMKKAGLLPVPLNSKVI